MLFRFSPGARAALTPLGLLVTLTAASAQAQVACSTDSQCPWSSCQAGFCAQPPGVSHIAEVQLDPASALTPLVDAAATALRDGSGGLCTVAEQDCDFVASAFKGEKCTLNRLTFPGPVSLRWSTQPEAFGTGTSSFAYSPIQAVVPFETHWVRSRCLNDPSAGCAFNQDDNVMPLEAVFTLYTQTAGGAVSLCEGFSQVLLPGTDLDILPLLGFVPPADQCIPLSQLTALSPQIKAPLLDAKVSASKDLSRLGVRLWFATDPMETDTVGPSLETYQAFLQGELAPTPTTASTDWSLFTGAQLMPRLAEQNAVPLIQREVALESPGTTLSLDTTNLPPKGWASSWTTSPPTTGLTLSLRTQDMQGNAGLVTVQGTASFALDTTAGTLTVSGTFGYSVALETLFGSLEVPSFILDGFLLGDVGSLLPMDGLCNVDMQNKAFTCTLPAELPPLQTYLGGPSLIVKMTALEGAPTGLVLGGSTTYLPLIPDVPATAAAYGFQYGFDDCSSQRLGFYGELDLGGRGRVCEVRRVGDVNGEYGVREEKPGSRDLPKDYELDSYWGASSTTPLHVRVRTTNGSGLISVDPPKGIDFSTQLATFMKMASVCPKLETGWLGIPGKFDPHWNIDPPFDPFAVLIDRAGEVQKVQVQLMDVHFVAAERIEPKEADGQLVLEGQPLRVEATAWVRRGEEDGFTVPVTAELVATLEGKQDPESRLVSLRFLKPAALQIELKDAKLPDGSQGLSATFEIEPESVDLGGFL